MMETHANAINTDDITIVPLVKNMARSAFPNEAPDKQFDHLLIFFRANAWQHQYEKLSKTYVALYQDRVIAYFTLTTLAIALAGTKYKLSGTTQALLLGKLYVSQEFRSGGIGAKLLEYIVATALRLEELVGCRGIIVDANSSPRTVNFYLKNGFVTLTSSVANTRMFFPLPY